MTQEIPKQEWTQFFDDLTKRRFDWQTKIEIISEEIGDQILDEGLPLKGITAELRNGESVIEILVGQDSGHHQTHNISNPTKVAYLSEQSAPSDIVEIEEMDGTKTLIHIIAPMPLVVNDAKSQDMQAA